MVYTKRSLFQKAYVAWPQTLEDTTGKGESDEAADAAKADSLKPEEDAVSKAGINGAEPFAGERGITSHHHTMGQGSMRLAELIFGNDPIL